MLPAPLPLDYLKHADQADRFRRSRIRSGGSRVRRDPREHGREADAGVTTAARSAQPPPGTTRRRSPRSRSPSTS